jgi:lipopolysaccharide export system permease protein
VILQRDLIREILQATTAVLTVLLFVYLGDRFARFLAVAASGQISGDLVFQLLLLKLGQNLEILIPVAFYFGILLGLGRMYKDSEIVAILASGVGVGRLVYSVLWISVAIAILTLGLAVYASPEMATAHARLLARAKGEAETSGISPGRFRELSGGDRVFYVEALSPDRRTMRNVFVQVRRKGVQELAVAKRAYVSVQGRGGDRYVVLEEGYRYTGRPGSADYVITRFKKHAVRLDEPSDEPEYRKLHSLPTLELLRSESLAHVAELQWRFSQPISVIILGLFAVPLSRTSPRQGKYAKLFTAVIIFFIYSNAVGVAQKLVERGDLSPWIGVWPVHLVVALMAVWLIWTQNTLRWREALGIRKRETE